MCGGCIDEFREYKTKLDSNEKLTKFIASGPILSSELTKAIWRERKYQDETWGTISENPHSLFEWIAIMEKKVADAKQIYFYPGLDANKEMLQEILQVEL